MTKLATKTTQNDTVLKYFTASPNKKAAKANTQKPAKTAEPETLASLAGKMESLDKKIAAVRETEKTLSAQKADLRKKRAEAEAKVVAQMQSMHMTKTNTGKFAVSVRAYKPKTEIVDKSSIANKYMKQVVKTSIDKNAIYKDLKAGQNVAGAKLVPTVKAKVVELKNGEE